MSLPDTDSRLKEKFSFLEQLVVEEFISGLKLRQILCDSYRDIAMQSIGAVNVPSRLGRAIWHLFMHLVGPDKVKIRQDDIKLFFKSLDTLESAGSFAAEFTENERALSRICSAFYDLAEIASWYRIKNAYRKIKHHLRKIGKDCLDYESKNKKSENVIRKRRQEIVRNMLSKIDKLKFR